MTKQIIRIMFLCLLPHLSFGQAPDSLLKKKYAVGFIVSPEYSYRNLISDNSSFANFIVHDRDSMEQAKYSWMTGISFIYTLGKHLSFATGLLLADRGYIIYSNLVLNAPSGYKLGIGDFVFDYYYLEVPSMLRYEIRLNKITLYAGAGLDIRTYITTVGNSKITDTTGKTTYASQSARGILSPINLAAYTGFGIGYNISKKIMILYEPHVVYSITPIVLNVPIREYLYSAGTSIGIYYKF